MRVLVLAAEYPPLVGGVGIYARNVCRGLVAHGVDVQVVTSVEASEPVADDGVRVTRIEGRLNRRLLKTLPLVAAARQLAQQQRPDWLLAMTWTHDGVAARWLSARLKVPYAVVVHGSELLETRASILRRFVMRHVLRGAQQLVANSHFTRQLLSQDGYDAKRVALVHPPLDLSDWSQPVAPAELAALDNRLDLKGRRVLFTAARLVRRKGHAQVLEIVARLATRYPDMVYVMTGRGPYRDELLARARHLGIGDRVRFTGYVTSAELRLLHERAELYISPSSEEAGDIEGFGIALAEASACGKPVIAGDSGGVSDAVIDGETGLLVDPFDLEAIERAVVSLLDDRTRAQSLGDQGRDRVERELSCETQAAQLLASLTPRQEVSLEYA